MHLVKPLSFFLISIAFLGTAVAADDAAPSGSASWPVVRDGSNASAVRVLDGTDAAFIVSLEPGQRVDLNPRAGVCFTMRTYKVKPTERLRDNESGSAGYSTCQMGSNYKVRSADIPASK